MTDPLAAARLLLETATFRCRCGAVPTIEYEPGCTTIQCPKCSLSFAARQQLGLAKYGTTVADNPLALRDWLNHAYQECLDQAVYIRRAIAAVDGGDRDRDPADGRRARDFYRTALAGSQSHRSHRPPLPWGEGWLSEELTGPGKPAPEA